MHFSCLIHRIVVPSYSKTAYYCDTMEINSKNYCVILAGGRGRRLWPCSRDQYPKQFIDFFGTGRTQLQTTYDRFARLLPKENIYICTCKEYVTIVKEQLPAFDEYKILVEP